MEDAAVTPLRGAVTPLPYGRRPIIHVESPLRPQQGDPGWPLDKELTGLDLRDAKHDAFSRNTLFAKEFCRAVAFAGGIPQAPHLFFPLFLNDFDDGERALGLECGIQQQRVADEVWLVLPPWRTDFSSGMLDGMARARALGIPCYTAVAPHELLHRLHSGVIILRNITGGEQSVR